LKILSGRKVEALEDFDRDILSSLPVGQPFLNGRLHFLGDKNFLLLLGLFFFLVLLLGRNAQARRQAEHQSDEKNRDDDSFHFHDSSSGKRLAIRHKKHAKSMPIFIE